MGLWSWNLHGKVTEDVKHGGGDAKRRKEREERHRWEQRHGEFLQWLLK
jgi:hypothetical protein